MLPITPLVVAAAVAISTATATAAPPRQLRFINDDYPKALRAAKAKNVPLFVEAWAPW
jgi:hypothetical protein